jgi:hypothetical protein
VIEASLAGRVYLPCYRGRSCHGFAAQAAELRVREETGLLGISEVGVRSIVRVGDGWHAEVEAGGTVYDVDIRREEGQPTHLTCSTAALKRPSRYVAAGLHVRAS